jgi:L-lactate dehydrogenase complex protein LldE
LAVRVGLFVPCFVDMFYPAVAIATVRVLEHLGIEVDYPPEQTCCGQPHFNAGRHREARALAARFCRVFERHEIIVSPSGSCTAMVRAHYPSLVGEHPVTRRVFELGELLVDRLGIADVGARLPGRAVLHVGCHQLRALGAGPAAHALATQVRELSVLTVPSQSWCCGFGGTFSVKHPEISTAMGRRKLAPIVEAGVDYLVSTDASCLMHLGGLLSRQGRDRPRPLHLAEVLATATEAP